MMKFVRPLFNVDSSKYSQIIWGKKSEQFAVDLLINKLR